MRCVRCTMFYCPINLLLYRQVVHVQFVVMTIELAWVQAVDADDDAVSSSAGVEEQARPCCICQHRCPCHSCPRLCRCCRFFLLGCILCGRQQQGR